MQTWTLFLKHGHTIWFKVLCMIQGIAFQSWRQIDFVINLVANRVCSMNSNSWIERWLRKKKARGYPLCIQATYVSCLISNMHSCLEALISFQFMLVPTSINNFPPWDFYWNLEENIWEYSFNWTQPFLVCKILDTFGHKFNKFFKRIAKTRKQFWKSLKKSLDF